MGRPTPMPTPHPTPNPVKTCSTFTLKGFSIRNAGGGSLRSRGLAIAAGRRTPATEGEEKKKEEVTNHDLEADRCLGLVRGSLISSGVGEKEAGKTKKEARKCSKMGWPI